MSILTEWALALWRDRSGVTALEYGLIAGLIALAIVGSVTALGHSLSDTFSTLAVKV